MGALDAHASPVTPIDLVTLRDMGPYSLEPGSHIVAISPDKRRIAFETQQGDPVSNRYRIALHVMEARSGAKPRMIDLGDEIVLKTVKGIGGVVVGTGVPATITPIWSSDGQSVYFLKRQNGRTAVWRALADGRGSAPATPEPGEVTGLRLSADGRRIIYIAERTDEAARQALAYEALKGYRFDNRFVPLFSSMPVAAHATRSITGAIDRKSGKTIAPTANDRQAESALPKAISTTGLSAVVTDAASTDNSPDKGFSAQDESREFRRCSQASCSNPIMLWWTGDGKRVRYIRRDGDADSDMAIYEWIPGPDAPQRIYRTADLLVDCQLYDAGLLCAREQSISPRHLILLDPDTGHIELLFDPNPGFAQRQMGQVERLHWRNNFGIETFGDLVYPVGYEAGRSYPLIIVQYSSRGFLRGGTGDEFPILPFAAAGYAVLSLQRPSPLSLATGKIGTSLWEKSLVDGFKDRSSVLSSIEVVVDNLVRRGLVDPAHIGITGLSDGSSTAQFALVNSSIFKAASVSGCCWEPYQDAIMGEAWTRSMHEKGWPSLVAGNKAFWSRISLIDNARTITAPLLIQQSDDEYRMALASYTALRQAEKPVALYVYPGEFHFKWQPAHRLAAYERNLRWFDYWLRGIGDIRDLIETAEAGETKLPVPNRKIKD